MPKAHVPRRGSLQFWPRKRTKRNVARVRSWANLADTKLLGFAGYKVGMCTAIINDNRPHSMTKGELISQPVTLIECPPIKVASLRFYTQTPDGLTVSSQILAENLDKELARKITLPKKRKAEEPKETSEIRLVVCTQPKLTGIGKKKPDLFEVAIGGKSEDKISYAKEMLGKEIPVDGVFENGQQADLHAITKGKGFQGPVKRFGIGLKQRKSEKGRRNPGSLGPWQGQTHIMWRVAHAGQTGYHQRTEYNKQILMIGKPEEVNTKGGFLRYGIVRNSCVLFKGSVPGPAKRLIRFNHPIRAKKTTEAPVVERIIK
ncbi:MAG: 50S ribosomal protein L3 [archaeon]